MTQNEYNKESNFQELLLDFKDIIMDHIYDVSYQAYIFGKEEYMCSD